MRGMPFKIDSVPDASASTPPPYASIITPQKKDDECIAKLVAVLSSDEFKAYLSDTDGQDVLPAK